MLPPAAAAAMPMLVDWSCVGTMYPADWPPTVTGIAFDELTTPPDPCAAGDGVKTSGWALEAAGTT